MLTILTLVSDVKSHWEMRTQQQCLLLQKTTVVVEGVSRSLDPGIDMWSTSDPVVRQWVERHLGPAGRIEQAAEGAVELGRFLGGVPELLGRAAVVLDHIDAVTRNGVVLAPETVAAIASADARRNRWMGFAL